MFDHSAEYTRQPSFEIFSEERVLVALLEMAAVLKI